MNQEVEVEEGTKFGRRIEPERERRPFENQNRYSCRTKIPEQFKQELMPQPGKELRFEVSFVPGLDEGVRTIHLLYVRQCRIKKVRRLCGLQPSQRANPKAQPAPVLQNVAGARPDTETPLGYSQ